MIGRGLTLRLSGVTRAFEHVLREGRGNARASAEERPKPPEREEAAVPSQNPSHQGGTAKVKWPGPQPSRQAAKPHRGQWDEMPRPRAAPAETGSALSVLVRKLGIGVTCFQWFRS